MLVYNVTVKISWPYAAEWVKWMKEEHMPEMLDTGCFSSYRLLRLLEVDEEEGPTYVSQYESASPELYNAYIARHSAILRQKSHKRWGDHMVAFRTVMDQIG